MTDDRLRLGPRRRSAACRRHHARRAQSGRHVSWPTRLARQPRQGRPGADPHAARGDRGRARPRLRQGARRADGRGRARHRRSAAREHGHLQRLLRPRADPRARRHRTDGRRAPPPAGPRDLEEAARRLVEARAPLIVTEALGRRPEATPVLCRLAERLAAPMIDLAGESEGRASVPSRHPLDMTGARQEVVAEADVVLALDVTNLLGALGAVDRATRAVRLFNEHARVIAISLDDYAVRSWAHTFQSLVPVDLPIAADAGVTLPSLLAAVEDRLQHDPRADDRHRRAERLAARHAGLLAEWQATAKLERTLIPLASSVFAAEIWDVIRDEDWVLANGTAKGWARRLWYWRPERTYGGSGGAGLGYGLPAALGVTLAHRGSSKVCVNLQSDGDLLYG